MVWSEPGSWTLSAWLYQETEAVSKPVIPWYKLHLCPHILLFPIPPDHIRKLREPIDQHHVNRMIQVVDGSGTTVMRKK
jgi:hypothetical protein